MALLIGADPELFAFDKAKGSYVSVHDLLTGTKDKPKPVAKGAVQVDGTAAEFNITAAKNMNEFVSNIGTVRQTIETIVQQNNPNVVLVGQPWVEYPADYWKSIPDKFKELGCDPDYNAYTGLVNPRPDPEKIGRPSLRTGSGHIHLGWINKDYRPLYGQDVHFADCCRMTKMLDKFLLPVVEQLIDDDKVRRSLYGQPGAFRPKPYGVEYRVLSNKWVMNPEHCKIVYAVAYSCFHYLCSYQVDPSQITDKSFRDYIGDYAREYYYSKSYEFAAVAQEAIKGVNFNAK